MRGRDSWSPKVTMPAIGGKRERARSVGFVVRDRQVDVDQLERDVELLACGREFPHELRGLAAGGHESAVAGGKRDRAIGRPLVAAPTGAVHAERDVVL